MSTQPDVLSGVQFRVTGFDPLSYSPTPTVAGGANVSHTIWTVSCQCPDDISVGIPFANMQALLMNTYGYNLLGAQYGSGTLTVKIDDLGGLDPTAATSAGAMINAFSDALAAAGELNASGLQASSSNAAGWSFPLQAPNVVRILPPAQAGQITQPAQGTPPAQAPCSCCGSTFASFLASTVGLAYRAFGGGQVDPWSQQVLIANEAQSLIQAGMSPAQACAQATSDVQKNSAPPPSNVNPYLSWIIVGVAVLAILVISLGRRQ